MTAEKIAVFRALAFAPGAGWVVAMVGVALVRAVILIYAIYVQRTLRHTRA